MTRSNPLQAWKALLTIAAVALSALAHAQEPPPADDPPLRVGRM